MKKRFIFFVLLISVCIALVIPKTNALTLTESTEQQGGGGYVDVCLPYNKYFEFYCNEEVQTDSYETLIYTDTENVYKVFDDGTYNTIGNPNGWRDSQDVAKSLTTNLNPFQEVYYLNLVSGENAINRFYLQIDSICYIDTFLSFIELFYLSFSSDDNDFVCSGDYTLEVYCKPTLNYEGNGYIKLDDVIHQFDMGQYYDTYFELETSNHLAYYSELFEYYGVSSVSFSFELYAQFSFYLYLSSFPFVIDISYYALNSALPYVPTNELITSIFGGDIVEEVINPDFGSWLTSSLSGFMNFEIVDGWSFGIIFALIVAIPIVLYFLKYFFGG